MKTEALSGQLIVRYLLGDLPEEEQARLEDRAFSDPDLLQSIEDTENDLIDEYVCGALSGLERRQFERRFLASAERQKKIEFARALARVIPATEAATQPDSAHWWESLTAFLRGLNAALQFSMAAAALILLLGVSWLITETSRLREQVAQLQAERKTRQIQEDALRQQATGERARSEDLAAQLQHEQKAREELARQIERNQARGSSTTGLSFIPSLFLPPGIARGGAERPKLVVPESARLARLQIGLEREDEYQSFRVELRTAQGREVWTQDNLRPRQSRAGRVINLTIPGAVLSAGEYELTLKGVIDKQHIEDVRYYYFDALKMDKK